ncbi:MAG: hypothetical protein ACKVZH_26040 [Blastocatellia bacterium]
MFKQFSNLFRAALLLAFVLSLLTLVSAQKQPTPAPKKSGASASCDGALDIVPTKAVSFVRKRRPGKDTTDATKDSAKQSAPAESKPSPKPPNR